MRHVVRRPREQLVDKLDLDTHPAEQANRPFLATIEAVPGDPTRVNLTPWLAASGCLCGAELLVEKNHIAHVERTPHQHVCCGKTLKVVSVHFNEPYGCVWQTIFHQLATRVVSSTAPANRDPRTWRAVDSEPPEGCQENAILHYKQCINSCRNRTNPGFCRARCEHQLQQDLDVCF
jgi:hypothetical protein